MLAVPWVSLIPRFHCIHFRKVHKWKMYNACSTSWKDSNNESGLASLLSTYCGVARSCRLCFISLSLLGTRRISWRGTTPRGVTFYGLSAERAATRFIFNGNPVLCLFPWRDGKGRTESRDRARLTLLFLRHPDESLKVVSDLHERDNSVQIP